MSKHSHYYKDVSHLSEIDVYRVLHLFGVQNPCVQHAVKKLLCLGSRGIKDYERDLREAGDSIDRALEMLVEDSYAGKLAPRAEPEPIQMQLSEKVDPAAGLLVDAVKVLQSVEGDERVENHLRIQARAMLRKIENADYKVDTMPDNPALTGKPVITLGTQRTLERYEAASAQGVDLVTEELSKARARMPLFVGSALAPPDHARDAVESREVDSHAHVAATLVKGTHRGN